MIHKCTKCGHEDEINPAAEMGRRKKTITDKAKKQRKDAAVSRWAKAKSKEEDT